MGSLTLFRFLLSSVFAFSDCAEIDLRPALGPPRAQDGSSWCYAHSAADLISHAVGERISSVDIATTYLLGDERKLRRNASGYLKDYLDHHPDFEQRLRETRKDEDAFKPEHILSSKGIVDAGGKDDQAIVLSNLKGLCLASRLPASEQNLSKYLETIREDYLRASQKKDSPAEPMGAVQNDVAKIMAGAFQKWVDQKCGKRLQPKQPLLPHEIAVAETLDEYLHQLAARQTNPDNARASLIAEIDRLLDQGKPAAIGYDAYDLYPKGDSKQENPHGDHSSVIAARKKIKGSCHYFVRNHFGTTCGYRPEIEEFCEKENGGVWVPGEALKHLYVVISIR